MEPGRPSRHLGKAAIAFCFAAAFLWLAFGNVDRTEFLRRLREVDLRLLAVAVLLLGLDYWLRALRWWLTLRPAAPALPARACLGPLLAGFALNNVLPLRAGDVVRAFGFRDRLQVSGARILGTLVLERILDLLALLAILAFSLRAAPDDAIVPGVGRAATILAGGCVAIFVAVTVFKDRVHRIGDRILGCRPFSRLGLAARARVALGDLLDSFDTLRVPSTAFAIAALSLAAWVLEGGVFVAVVASTGAEAHWNAPWFALVAATLGTLLPSTPGYVGTFDYFAKAALTLHGANPEAAAAFALTVHAVLWLPITLAGAGWLAHAWGFQALRRVAALRGRRDFP